MKGLQETNSEYHDNCAISATGIKLFLKSPAHFKASQTQKLDTPALRFGRMAHEFILEPSTFAHNYKEFDLNRRTKAGREEWARMQEEGVEPIKAEELDQLQAMADQVYHHGLLPAGEVEQTFRVEINGVLVQCRPDLIADDVLYDLKTCQDIAQVDQSFYTYGYHIQDAVYRIVIEAIHGKDPGPIQFVFCEKSAPYDVAVREVDPLIVAGTKRLVLQALEDYKHCCESMTWPGVEGEHPVCKTAIAPPWIVRKVTDEFDMTEIYEQIGE
jgi:hypothetical protein